MVLKQNAKAHEDTFQKFYQYIFLKPPPTHTPKSENGNTILCSWMTFCSWVIL